MSRTGAATSRTSKESTKNVDRKSAPKSSVRPRSAAPLGKTSRAKTVSAPAGRHEIRSRESGKETARRTRMPAVTPPPVPDVPRKRKTADEVKIMKKTTADKPKILAEEKVRHVPPAEPVKAKAASPTREPAPKIPKAAKVPSAETTPPARRKRTEDGGETATRTKTGRGGRSKSFGFDDDLMADYVMDEDAGAEGLDEDLTLEPMELPLELLDPELVEVPRPAATPKPKPKPVTNRRSQVCANCGNSFAWLSVDQLCFNCLKKKLAQRKREDETYPGFTGEAEEEEDAS